MPEKLIVILCKKCKCYFDDGDGEKCSCRLFIITAEDGSQREEYGRDFESAALRFAENSDPGNDYRIATSGKGEDFFIRDSESGKTKTIRISGERTIEYNAEEL